MRWKAVLTDHSEHGVVHDSIGRVTWISSSAREAPPVITRLDRPHHAALRRPRPSHRLRRECWQGWRLRVVVCSHYTTATTTTTNNKQNNNNNNNRNECIGLCFFHIG